ncbi:MAG: pantoate--beta-alanine ligase [Bacteroidetes bacterium]|nr:MAG: pantoate--beta-alanine ligase [Bacteroidota bacterium]
MKIFNTVDGIRDEVVAMRAKGLSIGFVPTMGALHEGHLSLLRQAIEENDISICSIFVNPIQFSNEQDLSKYPRTLDDDCKKLEKAGCDLVFAPSVDEMYPDGESEKFYFGPLEEVMEGAHRPGHFNGVAVVVKRLFEICLPHRAYFGEKDFQQLMIIKVLVKQVNMPVEIIGCPIIREDDGLAMSSRNARLSPEERVNAAFIYKALSKIKMRAGQKPLEDILSRITERLNSVPGMKVEYLQVADENTLLPIKYWDDAENIRVFVATFLGEIRLIDNLKV